MTGFDLPGREKDAVRIAELEHELAVRRETVQIVNTACIRLEAELASARQELERLRRELAVYTCPPETRT